MLRSVATTKSNIGESATGGFNQSPFHQEWIIRYFTLLVNPNLSNPDTSLLFCGCSAEASCYARLVETQRNEKLGAVDGRTLVLMFTKKNGRIFRLKESINIYSGFPDNKDSFVRNQGFRRRAETDVATVWGSTSKTSFFTLPQGRRTRFTDLV